MLRQILVRMNESATGERTVAISVLIGAADDFAERAKMEEARRDRSRPGTGSHHQYAHSATLWRLAERTLRSRILDLDPGTGF